MMIKPEKFFYSFIIFLLLALGMDSAAGADEKIKYDPELLAQYRSSKIDWLSRIPMFVTWSSNSFASPTDPIVLGIVGEELNDAPDVLDSKSVNSRDFEVKRFNNARSIEYSHILYICASQDSQMIGILQTADRLKPQRTSSSGAQVLTTAKYSVLTVSDTYDFIEQGGIIRFVALPGKLGIEVNLIAARKQGLTISSQLLKLANRVIQ